MTQLVIINRRPKLTIQARGIQGPPGYILGPDVIPSPVPPTARRDGSPLQLNDVWIDTSQ